MIRDFVTGILLGGVVAGAGLGVASQLAPLERAGAGEVAVAGAGVPTPAPEPVDGAAAPAGEASPAGESGTLTAPEAAPEIMPQIAPEGEPPVIAGTDPVTQPETAKADAPGEALLRPAPVEGQPAPASIAPEMPAAVAAGEVAPATDVELPEKPAATTEAAPDQKAMTASGEAAAGADTVLLPETAGEASPDAVAEAAQEPGIASSPETPPEPVAEAEPKVAPETAAEATPKPVPEAEDKSVAGSDGSTPIPTPVTEPSIGTATDSATATLAPDTGLAASKVDGVTTGRLPSIAGQGKADDAATDTPAPDLATLPPIQRFARAFENPGAKPLFAVLLLDPGTPEVKRADLAALPFPVTFVIDPMAANAAEASAIYRAGGQEVVMLATGIPKGAKAADLEQSFATLGEILPEAVALMDTSDATFQDERGLSAEVVTLLAAQGRGVVTFDRGLNAADQVARRENLPAATVFRSLDDDGEDAPLIRRYLDRAAFKAAQEGRVVVIGTARPDTIAALMEWAIEGRSASVALAPITAVMAAE